ncbi:MAG: helix-turn-helix domain-containing protein [Bacteroidales bacterium]|jgi:hypothetical protein|nr:helix-turn-helix domain-containing protein [Bacteroidales bacterium]
MENSMHWYLIANDQDLFWGLTINTIGKQICLKGDSYPPPDHPVHYMFSTERGRILNEYQLLYLTRGNGVFESASFKKTKLKAGNAFLLFPGEWHNYSPDPETGWEVYWIGFKGKNIDNRVKSGFFLREKPVFYVGILDEIVQLYNQGISVAKEQKTGYQQILAGIANHLLGLFYSMDKNLAFDHLKVEDCIGKAKILFMEDFKGGIKLEEIAARVNMSYSRFRYLFREYTGFTPVQYIQELRIMHSKELLANTMMNIKEIALDCGFETSQYFCTVFRKKIGSTPAEYREFVQGKNMHLI